MYVIVTIFRILPRNRIKEEGFKLYTYNVIQIGPLTQWIARLTNK